MSKKALSLQSILDAFPVFKETDHGKLICTLTKHELPIAEVGKYVKTKKFLEQWGVHEVLTKYNEYFQDLEKGVLACTLTKRSVARSAKALQNHVNGTRFAAALAKAEEEKAKNLSPDSAETDGDGDAPTNHATSGNESDDEASSDKSNDEVEEEMELGANDVKDEKVEYDSDEDTSVETPSKKQRISPVKRRPSIKACSTLRKDSYTRSGAAKKRKVSDGGKPKTPQIIKKARRSAR